MDKYTKSLELFQACVDATPNTQELNYCLNTLLEFLNDNFDKAESTPENIAAASAVCRRQVPNEDILCNPPKVIDAVYPIALCKILLVDYRIQLPPPLVSNFDAWHARYGRLIIEAMSQK